jgi:Ser/Thr protein kinase RdoA (MazF antagonist)
VNQSREGENPVILSARNVADYLINRGIMSRDVLVDGDYAATDSTRRNRNFRVVAGREPGFFVKQVSDWDRLSLETLEREAKFYWLAWNDPSFQSVSQWLPRFHSYEPARHILVIELVKGGEDMGSRQRRLARFPEAAGALAGEVIGRFHDATQAVIGTDADAHFPEHVPWVLTTPEQPPDSLPSEGSLQELLAIVRAYPELSDGLAEARRAWTTESLVHGDLKWENLILTGDDDGPVGLKVIDWELVHRGDPAWDVGALFQAYLNYWVFTMPAAPDSNAADLVRKAPWRIESMQPAMRALWRSYTEARKLEDPRAFLRRSLMFAACRLLQTAYESVQYAPRLTPHAVLLLQLSANTLKDPDDAARRLAGI